MSTPRQSQDGRLARGDATRALLLNSAREVLRDHGYTATTMRAVAERAGTRLSQVHYHFGSKRGLLIAVLEHENAELLERQHALYAGPEPLAEKWRTACQYLREDVRSGFVRILWELWAAGLADDELAGLWRKSMAGWRTLLEDVITRWAEDHDVDLPMSPRALATLTGNLFEGAEVEILAGVSESEAPHLEALEAVALLIDQMAKR
jgi:AcrR family transcriptional regulator